MKAIINYLEQLDFSKIEIKLYLRLLASGPMTVAELSEKAKINRTTIYTHIKSLLSKGIITQVKGESNKVKANPPDHLQYLLEQKVSAVKIMQDTFPSIINSLNASFSKPLTEQKSEIKYYQGKAGAKAIYADCLKATELRSYFNGAEIEKIFPENLELFANAFKSNSKIKMFEILEDSPASRKQLKAYPSHDRYFSKFLPDDVKLLANDILIYDGKVAIINLGDKHNISGVILSNKDYYNNSKQLFDLLWRFLPNS